MFFNFFNQGNNMKKVHLLWSLALVSAMGFAAETHGDKELKEDIARHRAMAAAHEGAAKCLEAGNSVET